MLVAILFTSEFIMAQVVLSGIITVLTVVEHVSNRFG